MDEKDSPEAEFDPEEPEEPEEVARTRRRERVENWVEGLSPEHKAKLGETAKRLSQSFASQIDLPAIRGILDQQRDVLREAFAPMLEAQRVWSRQLEKNINSNALKTLAPVQEPMRELADNLARNVDFGGLGDYAKLTEQIRTQQAQWFKDILPDLARPRAAFWPPNLREIEGLRLEDVEAVVLLDGIGLYGVPRQATAQALIAADSVGERREILGRRWKSIADDCRQAIGGCGSTALAPYTSTALAAIDALEDGHTQAAQALIGSLIDSILIACLGNKRYLYTPNKRTKNFDTYKEFGIRKFIALAPMWQTHQQFWARNGDAVPITFNRNATAHSVSSRQFSRRNAVQGLLFACGLIIFLEEQLRRADAQAAV